MKACFRISANEDMGKKGSNAWYSRWFIACLARGSTYHSGFEVMM